MASGVKGRTSATTRVVLNPGEIERFLRTPDGPLARKMMIAGDIVKVRTFAMLKPGFPQQFLGPYLVKRMVEGPEGPIVQVGSAHVKTKPHIIQGNPLLSFYWAKKRKHMIVASVHHPGSDFSKYLLKTMRKALSTVRIRLD